MPLATTAKANSLFTPASEKVEVIGPAMRTRLLDFCESAVDVLFSDDVLLRDIGDVFLETRCEFS